VKIKAWAYPLKVGAILACLLMFFQNCGQMESSSLQSPVSSFLDFSSSARLASYEEIYRDSTVPLSTGPSNVEICKGVFADNAGYLSATKSLQICVDGAKSGSTLALPPGDYLIDSTLFIHRGSLTITTKGLEGDSRTCLKDPTIRCARLVASADNRAVEGVLEVKNGDNLTLDHLVIDANRDQRIASGQNPVVGESGRVANIFGGDNLTVQYSAFVNAVSKTGLGLGLEPQPMKNLKFNYNFIAFNGRRQVGPSDIWADGLTIGEIADSQLVGNLFVDNTDVDFILGGATNTLIKDTVILHQSRYTFAAFMLTNWTVLGGAPKWADFRGLRVENIDIQCGLFCDIGVQLGVYTWNYESEWDKHRTMGGLIENLSVSTARQGIVVAGGGTREFPIKLNGYRVDGPLNQPNPSYVFPDAVGRRASKISVTGPGVYSEVIFENGEVPSNQDDWRLGQKGRHEYQGPIPRSSATCSLSGSIVADGSSVTAYASASVPFGASCQSEVRTCSKGTLSGSYLNRACQVQSATSQNCTFSGNVVSHGASVMAFASSSVPYGSSCQSQVRTCSNGFLSGSYSSSSCNVQSPSPGPVVSTKCMDRNLVGLWISLSPNPAGVHPNIKHMYGEVLGGIGRYSSGAVYLSGLLAQGYTLQSLRNDLINDPTALQSKVNELYQAYLNRNIASPDFNNVKNYLRSGGTLRTIEQQIVNSPECKAQ